MSTRRRLDFGPDPLKIPVLGGDPLEEEEEEEEEEEGPPERSHYPHDVWPSVAGAALGYTGKRDDLAGLPGLGGYTDGDRGHAPPSPTLQPQSWSKEQWRRLAKPEGTRSFGSFVPREGYRRRDWSTTSSVVPDPDYPGGRISLLVLRLRELRQGYEAAAAEERRANEAGDWRAEYEAHIRYELLKQQYDTLQSNREYGFGFVRDRERGLPPVAAEPVKPKRPMMHRSELV